MSGVWNPLSALDIKEKSDHYVTKQKCQSDSELVAADLTSYSDPVKNITSPGLRRATSTTSKGPLIAADMSGVWNPLSVLNTKELHIPRQKSLSDSELVAVELTSYSDPVKNITSPGLRRATSTKSTSGF
ncbi:hypothetical protein EGW08_013968 [Elysia chlorotica]|uniref:Uncharacterized protein n=1 Tax=Elysia chlorotica TaxID=188477 RepID=A0A3S1BYK5_ELYCH|nr:hypothetical protein EGW08_013968 [Elysia chlorotica]